MATLIPEFVAMLRARIVQYSQLRTSAQQIGDIERADYLTVEIEKAESTLSQLQTLPE
jgi:hypothetical protein